MRILAIEQSTAAGPVDNLNDLLRDEAAAVWRLQQSGIIREIWFTRPDRRAVIMLECVDTDEARQHLATLPLVHRRQIEFSLLELRHYDGLERLFASRALPGVVTALRSFLL